MAMSNIAPVVRVASLTQYQQSLEASYDIQACWGSNAREIAGEKMPH
jgi:hypothetical protein